MNRKIWSEEEDKYIKDNFGKKTFSEMSKNLGCSISTVQNRAASLGFNVEKKTIKRWTDEEIELLKIMSTKYLNKTIARKLGRSVQEVNKKARLLEIELIYKRPIWKKWKIKYLKENLNKQSISKIEKELELNYYQIMEKIDELGLSYTSDRWTDEEEKILIELSSKCYINEIAKVLNRTESAVCTKANKMGLEYITLTRKYTNEELEFIKNNWGIIPVSSMARKLKVSRAMVQRQADLMNLPRLGNNPYRKWTDESIEKLRKLSKSKTITQLAKYFKTTNDAITTVASNNCIDLIDEKVHWTDEDNLLLREYAKTMTLAEIALKMNRGTSAIRLQAKRQGITIKKDKKYEESVWTEENSEQLRKLVNEGKTLVQIAKIMNKKDQTLSKKVKELGLKIKKSKSQPWTEEEIERLRELSKTKKLNELVRELERSSSSIRSQAKQQGINIMVERKNWTEDDLEKLEHLVNEEKKSPKEIAELLGRTEDSIIIKINRRGLKIQTNDKRYWTQEEEMMLSDLWGSEPIEKIAKKLNRTVSSIRNKSFQLELGSQIENNYDGLKIKDISDLFDIGTETVSIHWVALGLKSKTRYITQSTSYQYVEIKDLYEFLENNQNIWDSRYLEKNILGKEPEWLQEKRKSDKDMPVGYFGLDNLTKQQLLQEKKYYLESNVVPEQKLQLEENKDIIEKPKPGKKLVKSKQKGGRQDV